MRGARTRRPGWFAALLGVAIVATLAFLVLPVVAIFAQVSPGRLISSLGDPVALDALTLSVETTTIAVLIIVLIGTPAAYLLATRSFPGHSLVVTLVELPLVLPPAVAGIGLLAAFGPAGLLGGTLRAAHIELVLQTAGVVVALIIVAAPFYLIQAQAAFGAVQPSWIEASRTLGADEARTFARIVVPAASPGLLAGLALAWARALGEFGATLIFAGSFRGITQTAPLAIYNLLSIDLPGALALSAVLVIASAALLLSVRLATGGGALRRATR
ncbi:MAG: molybdate ABC transporter permease subunit [Solirubrobacteraceae bacterium]